MALLDPGPEALEKSSSAAAKTRRPARLLLAFSSAMRADSAAESFRKNERINYEVFVGLRDAAGTKNIIHTWAYQDGTNFQKTVIFLVMSLLHHITPILPNGEPRLRRLRAVHSVLQPYVLRPPPHPPVGLDPDLIRTLADSFGLELELSFGGTFKDIIVALVMDKADVAVTQPNIIIQVIDGVRRLLLSNLFIPPISEVFPWLGCVPCTHPEIPLLFPRESLSKGLIVHCGISFHPRDMGGCGTGNFCCCSFNVTTQHVRNTLFVLTKITKIFFPVTTTMTF